MEKLLYYPGEDETGVHSHLVVPGRPELVKTAAPLHDEVQQFIAHLKPHPDKTYALINALGAAELYGSNRNADAFSIASLKYEPPGWPDIPPWEIELRRAAAAKAPYGHTTFYQAGAYRHHKNRPYPPYNHPSYGNVVLSVWNDTMKRVELIEELDHNLCRAAGGWDIIERLENGEYLAVSMGCRIKFDVCSVCGHKSPTKDLYCLHMNRKDPRFHPNMILPDGRRIWVWNPYPRFFDISYVLIGADRTAKVIALLASGKRVFIFVKSESLTEPSADRAHDLGYAQPEGQLNEKDQELLDLLQDEPQVKAAAQQKVGTERKVADIIKEVPPDRLSGRAVNLLAETEPDLPPLVLDRMAQRRGTVHGDLSRSLGTAARLGVVLKPQEFQRLILSRCGTADLADQMEERGDVFRPSTSFGAAMRLGDTDLADVRASLMPFVPLRSMLGPALKRRVTILISVNPPVPTAPECCATSPLLDEISKAYNGYRMGLLSLLARGAGLGPAPQLDPMAELFRRKPVAIEDGPLAGLFTSGPVVYLIRAHWGATDRLGPEVDERIIRNHPELVAKLAFAVPA